MLFNLVDLNTNTDSSIIDSSRKGLAVKSRSMNRPLSNITSSVDLVMTKLFFYLLNHRHEISYSTLLRQLRAYLLGRRGFFTKGDSNNTIKTTCQ